MRPRSRRCRSRGKPTYEPRQIPRIRILIQELDTTGIYSVKGEHFSVIAADFDDVVATIREALMEKYAACIGRAGDIVFLSYKIEQGTGEKEVRCPYCDTIIGFDPHRQDCPLHKVLVARWTQGNSQ